MGGGVFMKPKEILWPMSAFDDGFNKGRCMKAARNYMMTMQSIIRLRMWPVTGQEAMKQMLAADFEFTKDGVDRGGYLRRWAMGNFRVA